MAKDYEAERRRKAIEAQRLLEEDDRADYDIISTPGERRGNGKRWWNEVWGKVVAGLLLLMFTGIVLGAWAKAKEAAAATAELYNLPPMVKAHEVRIHALEGRAEMSPEQVKSLADQIADAWEKREARKKGGKP